MNRVNNRMYIKTGTLFFIMIIVFSSCQKEESIVGIQIKSPENVAKLVTQDLFTNTEIITFDRPQFTIHYAEVAYALGVARYAGLVGDGAVLDQLYNRYLKAIKGNIQNTANHVDINAYGALPLELYRHMGNEELYEQGIKLADSQWANPLPNGLTRQTRYWVDDIWMIAILQVQAFRATGKQIYLDRTARQIVAYLDKLQKPNGLFEHGEGSPFYWGRGNGWAASGMAELLSELPADHEHYTRITSGFHTMMNALAVYQTDSGMWRQLVNVPTAWEETSSTSMFGYAMVVGVKKGILPEEVFKPIYRKAWSGLLEYINDDGQVREVCIGTGKGPDLQYYLDRSRTTGDYHGQAPLIWFATSLMSE